jgi:phenylacetate-CoA ligase
MRPAIQRGLVLTTLTREALPLMRYRTGDISSLDDAPCPCGRTQVQVVDRPAALDELTVICELAASELDPSTVRARVARAIHQEIGLSVHVDLRGPGAVERSEGKAVRVVDRRQRTN